MARLSRAEAKTFVTALYRKLLLREPDDKGLRDHVDSLCRGQSPASVFDAFMHSEEYRATRNVKLFASPGHFYSPIVHPEAVLKHMSEFAQQLPDQLPGIALDRLQMRQTWVELQPHMRSIPFQEKKQISFRYYFDNPGYSWGDGSVLHAMLTSRRPSRLIEIGGGWSTACAVDTIERCLGNSCEVTLIEPFPQRTRDLIAHTHCRFDVHECPVQMAPLSVFDELGPGDMLLIDSTHVLKTGSDVCFELFEILPRLPKGVLVHFHDMFWPFEYPRNWVLDENRSWNELYAVRAFLTDNCCWRIHFFNNYFAKMETALIAASYPAFLRNSGGALWLERL